MGMQDQPIGMRVPQLEAWSDMCCSKPEAGSGAPAPEILEVHRSKASPRTSKPQFQSFSPEVAPDDVVGEAFRIFEVLPPERLPAPAWRKPALPVSQRPPAVKVACPIFVQRPPTLAWEEEASELPELPDATCSGIGSSAALVVGRAHVRRDINAEAEAETSVPSVASTVDW